MIKTHITQDRFIKEREIMKEREILQRKLEEAKNYIKPGDPLVYDFIYLINIFKYWDSFGYGHNLTDRQESKDLAIEMAKELLAEQE